MTSLLKRPRRIPYALQGVIFTVGFFVSVTLLVHMFPMYQSISQSDDYVFFGSPSALSQKIWLPGKFVPGIDERVRLRFALNGDADARFELYLPEEKFAELSSWFPVVFEDDGSMQASHVEVHGVRIAEHEWIVTSMESSYGEIDSAELWDYHLRSAILTAFWGLGLFGLSLFFLFSMVRRFIKKH